MEVGGPLAAAARVKKQLTCLTPAGKRSRKRGPGEWGRSEAGRGAAAAWSLSAAWRRSALLCAGIDLGSAVGSKCFLP